MFRKLEIPSIEGLIRQDCEVPEDKTLYRTQILAKIKEYFDNDSTATKMLIGIDPTGFLSRREEGQTFQELRAMGFNHTLIQWSGKSSNFVEMLIARETAS